MEMLKLWHIQDTGIQCHCETVEDSIVSDQIRSVTQLCLTLCDPMNHSTPGLPVHHQLPEFTETHVQQVSDAIQPSHPLSSIAGTKARRTVLKLLKEKKNTNLFFCWLFRN